MAATAIEIRVGAQVSSAVKALQTLSTTLAKAGDNSQATAKKIEAGLNSAIDTAKGFDRVRISNGIEASQKIISKALEKVEVGFASLETVFDNLQAGIDNIDLSSNFDQAQKKLNTSIEKMAADALGLSGLFAKFGTSVNLNNLVAAFKNADTSVEGLEAQIFSLRDAIELTADPVILQRFGQQLNALTSQLANTRVIGAVKVEKISIPKLDVPLVAPKIDLSALQSLQATFNSTIAPVDQLEAKIKGLEGAISKATNPAQPALFRAEIEKLKTQLSGLKFDKIDIDPTSLRVLQSAFIDANKPLTQLEAEIQVLETALKSATANGSKDIGRLSEQLGVLKAKFTTLTDTSLASAFTDATKSVTQLENEIFALGEKIQVSANPEEIVQFTAQINNLQNQLNNLKFGGIDLKINSSGLTALQSAFIDAIKPAQQLENEIEALEQALKINADPTALKIYGAQVLKLKQQLSDINLSPFEKGILNAGRAAQNAGNKFNPLKKGSNEAMLAITNLGRVAQDLPFGFLGIANNLNPLLESFQRLSKESGGLKGAMKALAGSVMGAGGIGLALSAFQFIALGGVDAVAKMFSGVDKAKGKADKLREAANAAKQAAQDFVEGLNDITQSRLKGTQSAQEELTTLKLLFDASQNENIAKSERIKIVDKLQAQYPKYFKNLSDETILAGGAKDAYLKLADAILQTARAQAEKEKLVDIQKQILTSEEQTTDALRNQLFAVQAINKAKATGRKETIISATGEERMTSFGADMVKLEQNLKAATENVNKSYKEKVSLIQRATNLSKDLNQVVENDPTVLLGDPAGKLNEAAQKERTKYNFFDKFFDFTPPTGQVEKQLADMFETARDFAQKNVDLFQVKVGDKFIDLSELQKVGNRKEVVELGKKVWASIQEGLIKFKPPRIVLDEEVKLIPELKSADFTGAIDSFIASMQKSVQGKQMEKFFDIPDRSQVLDNYVTKFKQIGETLPAIIEIEDVMGNLQNVDLNTAKGSEITFNYKSFVEALQKAFGKAKTEVDNFKEQFQATVQNMVTNSFVAIGDAIGNLISGSGIGEAFSGLFQFIGGAIQDLGKQMIALAPIFAGLKAAIKALDPTKGLLSGIALVALGGVIKNIKPKGFAAGGLVFGPTMGLVGEGSGTSRSNPEVIAPLDKLKNFLNPSGGLQHVVVTGRLSGNDILLSNQRQLGKNRRNG
jgi:hypothetical protein